MTWPVLGAADREFVEEILKRHRYGVSGVFSVVAWFCLQQEAALLPGAARERWGLGHRIAADAAARAREAGL